MQPSFECETVSVPPARAPAPSPRPVPEVPALGQGQASALPEPCVPGEGLTSVSKELSGGSVRRAPSPTARPQEQLAAQGGNCSLNKNGFEKSAAKGELLQNLHIHFSL